MKDSLLEQFKGIGYRDIDRFLVKNQRNMLAPEYMWGEDTNQNSRSDWKGSSLKVLVNFFSEGNVRSVSSTYNAIEYLLKLNTKNTFVDFCYNPCLEDYKVMDKKIPISFGNVSHRPWFEYDIVAFSTSIMTEVLRMPRLMYYSGIPFGYEARMKEKIPVILYGGAASATTGILYGYTDKEKNRQIFGRFLSSWLWRRGFGYTSSSYGRLLYS